MINTLMVAPNKKYVAVLTCDFILINRVIKFFITTSLFLPVAISLIAQKADLHPKPQRPDVLFVIADDWGYPHAGAYGDPVVKTPNFDRVAKAGVLFTNAYCAAPSCSPSRAAILTGLYPHRLEEGVNLWGFLPKKYPVYPALLSQAGYAVGSQRKGWGPGIFQEGGYADNPAGQVVDVKPFLRNLSREKPFCFWYGSSDPHRPYVAGTGKASGMDVTKVRVPSFLPDVPEIRSDIMDYYFEVERFDRDLGEVLDLLDSLGRLQNTIVVVTGDNGIPFPRAKANVYDGGAHIPLAMSWGNKIKGGRTFTGFVNLIDISATFLDAAGVKDLPAQDGKSLLPILLESSKVHRKEVYIERERHAYVRQGNLSFPVRAVRNNEFLYVRNLKPDRWPAGDSNLVSPRTSYGDIDAGPSKQYMLQHQHDQQIAVFSKLALQRRPEEELYDLKKDPAQLKNVARDKIYEKELKKLRMQLDQWMKDTNDPRVHGGDQIEHYKYYGMNNRGQ